MPRARTSALVVLLPLALTATALQAPTALAGSGSSKQARPTSYVLPGDAVFPEGITASRETFYVTSTTDGTVFRGDVDERRTTPFLAGGRDGRTTAIGLEVTPKGDRLVIAGGDTGQAFVYDTKSRSLIRKLGNGGAAAGATFLNDVAIAPNGDAYVTDSQRPVLYRIPADQVARGRGETAALQPFVSFTGTAFEYVEGFNANGIVITGDGRYAVVVQSGTGKLFRIGLRDKSVREIDLGGATVTNGDGLELRGSDLYVTRNADALIATVELDRDARRGELVSQTSAPSLRFPTTSVVADGRLLVVNSQFDKRGPGLVPETPFTVTSLRLP